MNARRRTNCLSSGISVWPLFGLLIGSLLFAGCAITDAFDSGPGGDDRDPPATASPSAEEPRGRTDYPSWRHRYVVTPPNGKFVPPPVRVSVEERYLQDAVERWEDTDIGAV